MTHFMFQNHTPNDELIRDKAWDGQDFEVVSLGQPAPTEQKANQVEALSFFQKKERSQRNTCLASLMALVLVASVAFALSFTDASEYTRMSQMNAVERNQKSERAEAIPPSLITHAERVYERMATSPSSSNEGNSHADRMDMGVDKKGGTITSLVYDNNLGDGEENESQSAKNDKKDDQEYVQSLNQKYEVPQLLSPRRPEDDGRLTTKEHRMSRFISTSSSEEIDTDDDDDSSGVRRRLIFGNPSTNERNQYSFESNSNDDSWKLNLPVQVNTLTRRILRRTWRYIQ